MDDRDLIDKSGLFDRDWYLSEYSDVAATGMDPLHHFLKYGAHLNRNPSPKFNTQYYLASNLDVAQAGINPLAHYILHGEKEGRIARPFTVAPDDCGERVDIVVPVFNALNDVKKCLKSIKKNQDGFVVSVIVVNDGSGSETTVWLKSFCDKNDTFSLTEIGNNRGYTKALNSGLKASSAPYVIALNSDTIVTCGWLKGLVRCINSDPKIGITGPLSNAASWQNVPHLYGPSGDFAVNDIPNGMKPDEMAQIVAAASTRSYPRLPFVNGFCFMIRREVIDTIGIMDEKNFPVGYGEENDYCIRASDAGFEFAIADDTFVFHAKSKSFGHDRRKELSKKGSESLKRKHSDSKLSALLTLVKHTESLDRVRANLQKKINEAESNATIVDPISIKILFLLPVKGGGGGAHSVVQEATEMRRLGMEVRIAVKNEDLPTFMGNYQDIAATSDLFIGFNTKNLLTIGENFDVVVGTIFNSMALVQQIVDIYPHILPAYYVQDYEPLFFPQKSDSWRIARESYTLVQNAIVFAKTDWIANKVKQEHDVIVHKVSPSIDHDVYHPAPKQNNGKVHIAAMIRPQSPRRGAERTMRVLSRLAQTHQEDITFHLFGCQEDDPRFQNLQRDFKFVCYGELTRRKVAALLARMDIFIDLSDYQAFGRTALEAMACGCVAIVPVSGGTDEYSKPGVNCLAVNSADEDECFSMLSSIAKSDDATRLRLKYEGLKTASLFSIRRSVISQLDLFGRTLGQQRLRLNKKTSAPLSKKTPALVLAPAPAPAKLPITALVITWDIGHNPLGRSYMLAEVLDRVVRNVVIVGFQFPRYGDDIWEPVRHAKLPVISLPGGNLPEFMGSMERIAQRIKPDIVIACKPRLPAVQLGALIKERWGCPLIIDIDDHELSFFKNQTEFTIDELNAMPTNAAAKDVEPYGEMWTRLSQHMRKFADSILVSNVALYREFGGTIVPHVRDETVFDPKLYDRNALRRKYGIPLQVHVVLFFGTPRHHKGVDSLAMAVDKIKNDHLRLVIVGTAPDRSVTAKLNTLAPGRIIYLPNQPFGMIPEIVAMADVIALPQDEAHAISQYQLPAKAIDAVAMSVPLLVTRTEPLMQLVDDGVAIAMDHDSIADALLRVIKGDTNMLPWRNSVRTKFLARYSYAAAAEQLLEIIPRAMRNSNNKKLQDFHQMLSDQRRVLGLPKALAIEPRKPGVDIVVFWKQNDTGLYGRRSDMVIKYLASREDVRKVIVFDAPLSEFDLVRRRMSEDSQSQDRLVYIKTYEKILGKYDTKKISYNVFVYPPGVYRNRDDDNTKSHLLDGYLPFIKEVFNREKVRANKAVFWIYPKNYVAPQLVDHFAPSKVVVDVVDDHRAWPGVSDEEKLRLTTNYRQTLARADMAFVNCESMQNKMKEFFPDIRLVPNGCDASPPRVEPHNITEYEIFKAWAGKTIGFVGNLEAKIDIDLIEKVAKHFSNCQIALLGSTHANPAVLRLKKLPNVRMPGVIPYEQLGAWLSKFDVGIIPHLSMEMTNCMNPLKLYVYLSWKVPVVSTEIYNVDSSLCFVYVARTHDEFLSLVTQALEGERIDDLALNHYLRQNDWESRFSGCMDELITSLKDTCCEK